VLPNLLPSDNHQKWVLTAHQEVGVHSMGERFANEKQQPNEEQRYDLQFTTDLAR
jgi:hypothetical protein